MPCASIPSPFSFIIYASFPIIDPHHNLLKKSYQYITETCINAITFFCHFFAGINFGWPMGNPGTSSITTFPLMSSTFFLFWWLVELMMWQKMTVILLFWQRAIKAFLWHIEQVYGVFNLILLILTFKSAIQVENTELCLKQALIHL